MVVTVPRNWRDVAPNTSTTDFVHRIGELMSTNRAGRMCPITYVLDDDIDPSNISDVLWALGTRIHPNFRQAHWPVRDPAVVSVLHRRRSGTAATGRSSCTMVCSRRSATRERSPPHSRTFTLPKSANGFSPPSRLHRRNPRTNHSVA